jgi:transcription antitermination factor NusG
MALTESLNTASCAPAWFALQVKATHERRVTAALDSSGYESFLPSYWSRRHWSDRIKQVELPLFPGYVFCRFGPSDRVPVLKTPSVARIVGFGGGPMPVDDQEIASLQQAVASGSQVSTHPFLQVGRRVRIENGPLAGLEGLITAVRGQARLVLSVGLLQRSVAVDIDSASVVPIEVSRTRHCLS